jgi:hypothetical protein
MAILVSTLPLPRFLLEGESKFASAPEPSTARADRGAVVGSRRPAPAGKGEGILARLLRALCPSPTPSSSTGS